MAALKITVSFKESEKWLYEKLIEASSSPATFLKDMAIKHFRDQSKQKQQNTYDDDFQL